MTREAPGGYATTFEMGVKQNTDPSNFSLLRAVVPANALRVRRTLPAKFEDSDTLTDWPAYYLAVYQTNTPVIAVPAFQASR
jgi:hypothetical protein